MKTLRLVLLMALWAGAAAAADVVVLRGGDRIDLKQPPVRQGNTVLLTKRDGTLLSVPYSEIDQKATAAAQSAASAPKPAVSAAAAAPATPAQAARLSRGGPQARVRLTDADVGHNYLDSPAPEEEKKAEGAGAVGGARVDIADYTQSKTGDNLIVKGTLRNLGTASALNARLTVTPIDEKGQSIESAEASVSSGTIEAGRSANFSATIPVGNKIVSTMRFSPRWVSQAPPAAAAPAAGAALPGSGTPGAPATAPVAAAAASRPPAPAPTPYGQGTLYAAPAANAPSVAPADGKTGYIPGAASPENQPKPPE